MERGNTEGKKGEPEKQGTAFQKQTRCWAKAERLKASQTAYKVTESQNMLSWKGSH